ncbi:MAG TPA: pyruvate dehydrogenase (acetyl-transferring) E1 component subunit alpha [Methanomassiliicoccales archaeon]|nr:pyruvate dehydrogenase (acetyl-transferring) E1 component subunit alpha [Methanomassiliicoccales archaeon]
MLIDDYDPLKGKRLQILKETGTVIKKLEPQLEEDVLLKAYRTMVLTRVADDKAVKLQRQGRLGAYPPNLGQEASQLGPAMAFDDNDWMVWAFREMGALIWKGVPLWRQFLYWMGNEEGNNFPDGLRVTPTSVPVGSQILHAVGISYASKIRKEGSVALVYFGDGGSSEGDFHEGLNMAGVLNTPTVFVCQNNQYAISMRRVRQTASQTIAQKALAYGFRGIQVDGNDLLALYSAAKEAVDRARNGDGPTLIESFTYRRGDHTTSDDASRYRSDKEVMEWEKRDPILRFRKYLEKKKLWDDEKEKELLNEVRDEVERCVAKAEAYHKPSIEDIFKYTYAEMPPELKDQMDRLQQREGSE